MQNKTAIQTDTKFHKQVMRSIWIMRFKYFIFGLFSGSILVFLGLSFLAYQEMENRGGWVFLQAMAEVAKIDITLISEFFGDMGDLLPVYYLFFGLLFLTILLILILIIWRFRKAIFLKADNNI